MDQRTRFLIQVLEKIGGPLTASVMMLPAQNAAGVPQDAQRVAELLNRSVQLGLSLAQGLNVRDESQADGVHLALAAFSGPLVAGQYMATGRVPGELEIRRLSGALQAVMTFADTFTPAADSTLRLENVEAGSTPADEALVHIQMLGAFGPVFQVISSFSFGRPENKLAQDVATRLIARAEEMRQRLCGDDIAEKDARRIELVLLKNLCGLYAAAHAAETQRLMLLSDADRATAGTTMDTLWGSFDRSCDIMRLIGEQVVPKKSASSAASSSGGGTRPADVIQPPQVQSPMAPPPTAPTGDPANPMSFFGAKKTGDGAQG